MKKLYFKLIKISCLISVYCIFILEKNHMTFSPLQFYPFHYYFHFQFSSLNVFIIRDIIYVSGSEIKIEIYLKKNLDYFKYRGKRNGYKIK